MPKIEYKLCYINGNKAWFTSDFENQWGDDCEFIEYINGDIIRIRNLSSSRIF